MKTNKSIAAAVLNIASADAAKDVLKRIINLGSEKSQELIARMLLGIIDIPEQLSDTVVRDGITLSLTRSSLDECLVKYTYETSTTRYFRTEEDATEGIKKRNEYCGVRHASDEYPISAEVPYTARDEMRIEEWIGLSKQGE